METTGTTEIVTNQWNLTQKNLIMTILKAFVLSIQQCFVKWNQLVQKLWTAAAKTKKTSGLMISVFVIGLEKKHMTQLEHVRKL